MTKKSSISLLCLMALFITVRISAQKQKEFLGYPLTQLVFNDGSSRCGYYDSTNNVLYDCTGNVIANKPTDVHHKLPGNDCCKKPGDTDGDNVADKEDKCPNTPGPSANFGCPVCEIPDLKERLGDPKNIFFIAGTYKLMPKSFPTLNQVGQILKDNPDYNIRIEGHTDSIGHYDSNIELSTARAAAVADYIVAAGIDKKRVSSQGFGPDRPIAANRTAAGRAKNRRVELRMTRF